MKTAFLYAGQGSQKAGMGKDLYERYASFREAFDAAELSFDLKKVCFEDPEGRINETEYTQPCMTAFAVGVNNVFKELGIGKPDFAAGLSLGEYSALSLSGVFDPKTAVETVAYRGKVMAECAEGVDCGMTAILSLPVEKIEECCKKAGEKGVVQICNLNCPGQTVIGGEKAAVEAAAALCTEAGAVRCIPLKVSGPFHTSIMAEAGEKLKEYFKGITFGKMEIPVIFNYLGSEMGEGDSIPELLRLQVQRSVRMEDSLKYLFDKGTDTFVEIGPGKVLSGFVRKTAKALDITDYKIFNVETAEDMEALAAALKG
ncbi:MAG: ACP S-malonyltransferase [Lachnospiraceae bacterium]|nr:ACP S-malonyltransferase [Lachnospiraceae bacterium]